MKMDWQIIINIGAGAFLAMLGWFARQLWDAVAELRANVHKIEIDLPSHYVKREEFSEHMREIRELCRMIFEKIDTLERRKVDK
jgi:hypothetical protein